MINFKLNSGKKQEIFVSQLLAWFKTNNRNFLPWRQTKDPYRVLVAELMLQKTTVKQVERVFPVFISKYPDAFSLSRARINEIREIITPLGMEHRRAPILKKLAQIIATNKQGKVAPDPDFLMSLEGIGRYITNAVLCLAFDKDVPMLDTNVIRVLIRVFDLKVKRSRARKDKAIWSYLQRIIPKGKGRDLNLAILDLGATICLPRNPHCSVCPINSICAYFNQQKLSKYD